MASVLNLVSGSLPGSGFGVHDRDDLIDRIDDNFEALDQHAAHVTASFSSVFRLSGSAVDLLGIDGSNLGSEFTLAPRVLQRVVAWAESSGSGGVSRIDVQMQEDVGGVFNSIFADNSLKPAVSSSLGNYGTASGSVLLSSSWAPRRLLKVVLDTAAGAAGVSGQKGLTVQVFWKPSGSYGV